MPKRYHALLEHTVMLFSSQKPPCTVWRKCSQIGWLGLITLGPLRFETRGDDSFHCIQPVPVLPRELDSAAGQKHFILWRWRAWTVESACLGSILHCSIFQLYDYSKFFEHSMLPFPHLQNRINSGTSIIGCRWELRTVPASSHSSLQQPRNLCDVSIWT